MDYGRHWTVLARYYEFVGIGKGNSEGSEVAPLSETDFLPLISFLQRYGGMDWETIMSFPLIRLGAIQDNLIEHMKNDPSLGIGTMLGGLGGTEPQSTQSEATDVSETMSREEFFAQLGG